MRHNKKGKRLGRPMGHRKALMKNLAKQFFMHGRIKTTITKAKVLKEIVEPIITRAKKGTVYDRREVVKAIGGKGAGEKNIIKKIFNEVAPLFAERNGGYTRIMRLKNRPGDNAEIVIIELIGFDTIYKKEEKTGNKGKKAKVKEKDETGKDEKPVKKDKKVKEESEKKEKPVKKEKKTKEEETPKKEKIKKDKKAVKKDKK